MGESRTCDALCRDIEQDRDRLYALLGDVAGALELALSAPIPTDKRETCVRILARAKEALS